MYTRRVSQGSSPTSMPFSLHSFLVENRNFWKTVTDRPFLHTFFAPASSVKLRYCKYTSNGLVASKAHRLSTNYLCIVNVHFDAQFQVFTRVKST